MGNKRKIEKSKKKERKKDRKKENNAANGTCVVSRLEG